MQVAPFLHSLLHPPPDLLANMTDAFININNNYFIHRSPNENDINNIDIYIMLF